MQGLAIGAEHQRRDHIWLAADCLQWIESGERPHFDRLVCRSGSQKHAVRGDGQIGDLVLVSKPHPHERVDPRLFAAYPAPQPNLFVRPTGEDKTAVGSEGGEKLFASRLTQRVEALTVGCVPEFDG